MPVRSITQQQYFDELVKTSEKYFFPYVENMRRPLGKGVRVLEVGCGVGGNLAPFAKRGCYVVGVDLFKGNTDVAETCFKE